jgi:hypothetical protein
MSSLNIFLAFFLFVALAQGYCWTNSGYHIASQGILFYSTSFVTFFSSIGFAAAIGRERSNGLCKYGNDTSLDDECPVACLSVILTVLGDCYWYACNCLSICFVFFCILIGLCLLLDFPSLLLLCT